MLYGYPVCINRSLKRLSADFQKYRPQNLFAVPLIVETLYKNIWSSAAKQGKDKLLKRLICIGNLLLKLKIDLRNVFFKSVMDAFGGNLNLIVSGGAPIDEKYIDGFRSFGITVLNGYGITECGPVVAVNRNRFIVPHSVGLPLCCNEVNIAENGEVLVKGENVMLGYYRDEKMTSQALTDGWFHTGDIGEIDRYGALHITGRIKNLIILANGENISAEWIEQKLYAIPYLNEVIVYGMDKLDEISLSAPTKICEIKDGWFRTSVITPEQFGLERCAKADLKGGTPAENAATTRAILGGQQGHKRNAVLMNAGAALYIGGKADSIEKGILLAADIIDSGAALKTLEKFIEVSNRRPEAEA